LEQLDEYVEVKGSDENVMELRYTTAAIGRIGSGSYANASFYILKMCWLAKIHNFI